MKALVRLSSLSVDILLSQCLRCFRFFCVCWVSASPLPTLCLRDLCWIGEEELEVDDITTITMLTRFVAAIAPLPLVRGLAPHSLVPVGAAVMESTRNMRNTRNITMPAL